MRVDACPLCGSGPFRNLGQHFRHRHDLSLREYVKRQSPRCESCSGLLSYRRGDAADVLLRRRFCSKSCQAAGMVGESHPQFKGGYLNRQGYRIVMDRGRRIFEHRLVMERHLGRRLRSDEVVHHKNGVKDDNRIENLDVMSLAEHNRHHHHLDGVRYRVGGSGHHHAKLSPADVRAIRRKYRRGVTPQRLFAARYGVHVSTISDVVNRKTYVAD